MGAYRRLEKGERAGGEFMLFELGDLVLPMATGSSASFSWELGGRGGQGRDAREFAAMLGQEFSIRDISFHRPYLTQVESLTRSCYPPWSIRRYISTRPSCFERNREMLIWAGERFLRA